MNTLSLFIQDKEFQYLASLVSLLNLKQYGDFYKLCQTALENGSLYQLSSQMNQHIQQLICSFSSIDSMKYHLICFYFSTSDYTECSINRTCV